MYRPSVVMLTKYGDVMPKYLCIQRNQKRDIAAAAAEKPSPAQMEQMMGKFNAWREKFQDNITDMGGPLSGDAKVVTADATIDGPFVEIKEVVGGYMIVTAENMDEAVKVAQESPGVMMPGSSVEVREIKMM